MFEPDLERPGFRVGKHDELQTTIRPFCYRLLEPGTLITIHSEDGPAERICQCARQDHADIIVAGSHGPVLTPSEQTASSSRYWSTKHSAHLWNPKPLDKDALFSINGSMKTTVDIPNDALRDLMSYTKAETKKEAIIRAVTDFNNRQRLSRLTRFAGTFHEFMSQNDLRTMREGKP